MEISEERIILLIESLAEVKNEIKHIRELVSTVRSTIIDVVEVRVKNIEKGFKEELTIYRNVMIAFAVLCVATFSLTLYHIVNHDPIAYTAGWGVIGLIVKKFILDQK